MELKFVSDEALAGLTTGSRVKKIMWTGFMEELYKHPNKWAEFPIKVNSSASAYSAIARFAQVEAKLAGGNNLGKNHPDKKQWTVYVRFVPETPAKIEEPKAPSKKK
jgi:hypothetical protein